MNLRAVAALSVFASLIAAMVLFLERRLEFDAGVTHFLSRDADVELSAISARIADSSLTRTMVLAVGGPDPATAIAAARSWEIQLLRHAEVKSVRGGPDSEWGDAVRKLYFPRRYFFLSESERPEADIRERLSDAGLRAAARRLHGELSGPWQPLIEKTAASDPLLAFFGVLERFTASQAGNLRILDGRFVDASASSAILLLTTRHSAFDAGHQADLARFLDRSFGELDREFGGNLTLAQSGVHRFAVASERSARTDMTRISAVSLSMIAILFFALFRSPRLLALSLLPLAAGILTATTAVLLCYGKVHTLTLAFGSTLIGVCIDYPIHYISHTLLQPSRVEDRWPLSTVWIALAMGASTSAAGFAGLAVSDIPGLREVGIFSVVGIVSAVATTRWLLPPLMPESPRATVQQAHLSTALAGLLEQLRRHPRAMLAVPVAAVVVCAAGLPSISWVDDIYTMTAVSNPEWMAEDRELRNRVGQMDTGRLVAAIGPDLETALRRNDAVFGRLSAAVVRGDLDRFRSLHSLLWSAKLQERNLAGLSSVPDLEGRLAAALEAEGFHAGAFDSVARSLASMPGPLEFSDLQDSPLAELAKPFHVPLDDGEAILTFLSGVRRPEAIEEAVVDIQGVSYFDQRRFLSELYGSYRRQALTGVGVGLVAVFALLQLRYRRLRLTLAAGLPAVLAASATAALLSLAGVPTDLLGALGLLLVLGFGVDYSIFLLESASHPAGLAASLSSLVVACASTCLAFGLLGMSSFPALRSLGMVTSLGVLLSLVAAPAALILAEPTRK